MKLTITRKEVDALILGQFNLPPDAEVVVSEESVVHPQEPKLGDDDWIINTQTEPFPPDTLDRNGLLDIIYSNDERRHGLLASVWTNSWYWNVNNKMHIVKYRKVD